MTSRGPHRASRRLPKRLGDEGRFRALVETSSDVIFMFDPGGRVHYMSPSVIPALGWDPKECLGRLAEDFVYPDDRPAFADLVSRAMVNPHESVETDLRAIDSSKTVKHFRVVLANHLDDPALKSLVGYSSPMPARGSLAEGYRVLLESALDATIVIDADSRITLANARAARLLGYQQYELVGRPIGALLAEHDDRDRVALPLGPAGLPVHRSMEGPWRLTCRQKGGQTFPAEISVSQGPAGRASLVLTVCDVSEKVKIDKALAEREARLAATFESVGGLGVTNLESLVTRTNPPAERLSKGRNQQLHLSDQMVSLGTLAAGVVHEINNPLSALIGNLDLLTEELERPQKPQSRGRRGYTLSQPVSSLRAILRQANEAAERVRQIVQDVKLFSRGGERVNGELNLELLLESALRMALHEIRNRARVIKSFRPTPSVYADEGRLGQVLVNLIANAAQAIPEGNADKNEIKVSTGTEESGRVFVEIADSGGGIAPEILPRIFDPFFTTKPIGVGTGIGLAICRQMIAEMNGTITVDSELGRGSVFRVSLPAFAGSA